MVSRSYRRVRALAIGIPLAAACRRCLADKDGLAMPVQNYIKPVSLNDRLVNRAAWRWLKEAREPIDPYYLHLLTLAWWGWENGVRGDCPSDRTYALKMQVELLFGWKPENVMTWLFNHPDGPEDPLEQEESLLIWLKTASSPLSAVSGVLSEIWYRQQADCPTLR